MDSEFEKSRSQTESPVSFQDCQLEQALQLSSNKYQQSLKEREEHYKRIETFVANKNLILKKVPADGDCFMNAILAQLEETVDPDRMRQNICDHLLEHHDEYCEFFVYDGENKENAFREEVKKLSKKGSWNTKLSDLVPMAAANILDRCITIYSSNIHKPEYGVLYIDSYKVFYINCIRMYSIE